MPDDWKNTLYYGDNLDILRRHVQDESVDLIYLDPPFNSNATYNVLFAERNGSQAAAQIKAFGDTWEWNETSARAFHQVITTGPDRVAQVMDVFQRTLGTNNLLAYLSMMAPRLVELRRVLKDTGSIYLHCDPTASHYLRMLMDAVFGAASFRNEIAWKRTSAHSDSRVFGNAHDIILYYSKTDTFVHHKQHQPYDRGYVESHYRHKDDRGRLYRTDNLTATSLSGGGYTYEWHGVTKVWRCPIERMQELEAEGRLRYTKFGSAEYIRYLDEMPGAACQDVWDDIRPINSQARERLGYPTQKPEALLERIIRASSSEGDLVLDPFCGCGTTIVAAERLKRRWIGIDITHLAIGLMRHRLRDAFGEKEMRDGAIVPAVEYDVIGEPVSLPDARALAARDKYQFQWWALGRAGARPAERKKGADRGIDGRMYFLDEATGAKTKQIVLQVKAGKTGSKDVRDLRGVLEREKAEIGVLITMQEPTSEMRREAASAGFYASPGQGASYPRLQILTVSDLLKGARIGYPPQTNVTFKKAPRARRQDSKQNGLFEETEET